MMFAGDGTICATVLTLAIYAERCKSLVAGMDAMDLRHWIAMAVDVVVKNSKSRAWMMSTSEEIAQDGKTLYNELEVVEGMKLDRGYMSLYFLTNTKTQKFELEDPLILVHEKKISSLNAVVKVLEMALKERRPLLIVAEDVESEALATLFLNKLRAVIKVHDFGLFRYDPSGKQFLIYEEIPLAPEAACVGLEIRVVADDNGEKVSILASTLARLDRDAPHCKKTFGNNAPSSLSYF